MFQPLGGVAVIADNSYAAFKGRKSLKIEWDSSSNEVYNSGPFAKRSKQHRGSRAKSCVTWAT